MDSTGTRATASEDDPRRRLLLRALASGALVGGCGWSAHTAAALFGKVPGKLPEGRSIFEMQGDVRVNGRAARADTVITASDRISTGAGASIVAVIGQDALILREHSDLQLGAVASAGARAAKRFFRLVTGAMLTVFGPRDEMLEINTPTVTIGIRGTGVYTESAAERSYVCTCYGQTRISAADDPRIAEDIRSRHHDAPRYVLRDAEQGRRIIAAPFKNHTDLELRMLEALVGREVPFALEREDRYSGPQRDY
ncbi:MAG: FecR domain-containing protein [Nevskiales bacterium]|nr:FecR domain-containing protein [Nevskiales bacterium]